ncbi:MAG TPA: hypothetical protein P5280_17880, partial [Cyclobacteriaceae bacterium]|nr:hypothetical protein [Cyclobacteriaceae bacterium]
MSSFRTPHDWFQYLDRNDPPYNPTIGTTITVERFWQNEVSKFNSPDWRREEWLIRCALVPVDQLNAAADEIASPHYLTFEMGWNSEDQFGFGDYSHYGEIQLYPLALLIKHPISQEFSIELNRKFVTYHALQRRDETHYYHPTDNLIVAEAILSSHEIYDPTAHV